MRTRIIVVFITAAIIFMLFINHHHKPPVRIIAVAVMPFANATKDPRIDWVSAGIVSSIDTKISQVANIRNINMSHIMVMMKEMKLTDAMLEDPATAARFAKVAGAKYIIIGSYRKDRDNIKVVASVIKIKNPAVGKSISGSGSIKNIFDIETDIAKQIAGAIGVKISARESIAISKAPTKNLDAYISFSKALSSQIRDLQAESIKDYTEAIRFDPNYATAYRSRGVAYLNMQDYDPAMMDLNKAIGLEPDLRDSYYDRGIVYYYKKDYDSAIADFSKAREIDPLYADAYTYRGRTYSKIRENYKAIANCSKAVELNPDDAKNYIDRGLCYCAGLDYRRAIEDFSKAIEIDPYHARSYYDRGYAYHRNGHSNKNPGTIGWDIHPNFSSEDFDKALVDFSKAIKMDPGNVYCYYYRGEVYADLRNNEKALADYYQFLKVAPKSERELIEIVKKNIESLGK